MCTPNLKYCYIFRHPAAKYYCSVLDVSVCLPVSIIVFILSQKVSEYDEKMSQSHSAEQPKAP